MKTILRCLLLAAGVCLIFSCSKDEPLILPGVVDQDDATLCGKVFKVQPTKGTDITAELKQAFDDAKTAGPGSVVDLPEGEFEIEQIEIGEFYGSFVGAGKGRTIISPKTGLDCTVGALITFTGGDILVSDMTIKTPEESICADGSGLVVLLAFADYSDTYVTAENFVRSVVNNVEFISNKLDEGGYSGYNCWNGLAAGQNTKSASGLNRSNIDMTITNCSFDSFGFGTQIIGAKSGKYTLGTKNNGNTFTNCLEGAFIYDIINMPVKVTGNKFYIPAASYGLDFSNYADARFVAESQTSPTVVNIEENKFFETGSNLGLLIRDNHRYVYPDELPMNVQLKNNNFNLNGAIAAIGCFNMNGMVIRNNKFTGNSLWGVRIMKGGTLYNVNGLMLGNNFSNLSCSMTTVLLNTGSSDWTIVGGDLGESTLDLGVNNIITGYSVIDPGSPLGQTIVDNLKEMREASDEY